MRYVYLEDRSGKHFKFYEMIVTTPSDPFDFEFEGRWGRIGFYPGRIGKPKINSKKYIKIRWWDKIMEKQREGYKIIVDETNEKFINNILKFNKLIDVCVHGKSKLDITYVMFSKLDYIINYKTCRTNIPYDDRVRLNKIWKKCKFKENKNG